ncbi:MAG: hypothetical protein HC859_07215 [Bacteroidia bacterium]|nr:hypothetical protein [Bacteroidia bacterium]
MKTKFGRLLKLVLVNLVIFVVLLYVLNWGAGALLRAGNKGRETLPNYSENPSRAREIFYDYGRVAHAYEPFTGWRMRPYSGKTLHINEHGWRVHEVPAYQATKDTSVWFFGGSTMWGEGADDDHTIPALYNKKYPQFDVKNFGQLAYNSRQELDALISLYSEGQRADKVIFTMALMTPLSYVPLK